MDRHVAGDVERSVVAVDQVGTPIAVRPVDGDTTTPLPARDVWGMALPGETPVEVPGLVLGFAGGIEDPLTGLVRFGHRDYEPLTGRWMARDPLLLDGGQVDLYAYVGGDPVARRDPTGLICFGFSAYGGVGGGISLCLDSDAVSLCGEVGFGAGGGFALSNEGAQDDGTAIYVEGGVECGPAAGTGHVRLDSCGRLDGRFQGQLGPLGGQTSVDLSTGEVVGTNISANALGSENAIADVVTRSARCRLGGRVAGEVCGRLP
ncbi:RHS repeat-associated core domain-containing protein [Euzebya sp.]|uniref:RHS repeat-associated core domain-containing protein n=1 Tax=Euzebya sp. TaxID=1971409 RepID=UPI003515D16C